MRQYLLVTVLILAMGPSILYGQQSFVEYKEGDSKEELLKHFHFLKVEDECIKMPNMNNGKYLLPTYKNYNDKSDTIMIEQLLYAGKWKNFNIIFANLFGLKRSVVLAFDNEKNNKKLTYTKEDNYIEGFKKDRTDSLLFFMFKTKYSTNCSEQKTFFIFSLNLRNGFFNRAFSELSDIEYFSNEPICRKGVSYETGYNLNKERTNNEETLSATRKIGNRQVLRKYRFKNSRFVL